MYIAKLLDQFKFDYSAETYDGLEDSIHYVFGWTDDFQFKLERMLSPEPDEYFLLQVLRNDVRLQIVGSSDFNVIFNEINTIYLEYQSKLEIATS
jgi:hypothetical protein